MKERTNLPSGAPAFSCPICGTTGFASYFDMRLGAAANRGDTCHHRQRPEESKTINRRFGLIGRCRRQRPEDAAREDEAQETPEQFDEDVH